LNRELDEVKVKNHDMDERLKKLELVVIDNETRASAMAKEQKLKIDALGSSVASLTKSHDDMKLRVDAAFSMARRERMLSKAQRVFSKSLAEALAILRARIYVLLHIDEMKNSIPNNMIDPPKKKEKIIAAPIVQQRVKRAASSFGTKAYAKEMEELREQHKQMKAEQDAGDGSDGEPDTSKETPLYVTRKWFFHLLLRLRRIRLERPFIRSSAGIGGSSSANALRLYLSTEDELVNSFVRAVMSDMDKLEHFVHLLREDQRSKSSQIIAFKQFLNISDARSESKYSKKLCDLDVDSIRMLAKARAAPTTSYLQRFQMSMNDPEMAKLDIMTMAVTNTLAAQSDQAPGPGRSSRRGAISMPAGFIPQPMVKAYENAYVASERSLNRRLEAERQRVSELEDEVADHVQVKSRLEADLDIMVDDYEFLNRQNKTLKTALEDSYRVHKKMNADELRQRGLDIAYKQSIMRSKSTQVACVSCDLELANISDSGVHLHKTQSAVMKPSESGNSLMARHDIIPDDAVEPFDSRGKTVVLNRVPLSAAPVSPTAGLSRPADEAPIQGVLKEFLEGNRNAATEFKKLFVSSRQRPQSARPFEKSSIVEDAFSRSKRVNDIAMASTATYRLPDLQRQGNESRMYLSQSHSQPILDGETKTVKSRPQTAFAKIKSIPQKTLDADTNSGIEDRLMDASAPRLVEAVTDSISAGMHGATAGPSTLRKAGAADAQMAASLQVLHETRANDLAVAETYERLREYERMRLLESLQSDLGGGGQHVRGAVPLGNKAPRTRGGTAEGTIAYPTSSPGGLSGAGKWSEDNLLVQGVPHHPEQIKFLQSSQSHKGTTTIESVPSHASTVSGTQ
jgi:hypothetical protein